MRCVGTGAGVERRVEKESQFGESRRVSELASRRIGGLSEIFYRVV